MSAIHFTLFLANPFSVVPVSVTLAIIWFSWAMQFYWAYEAVNNVFSRVPGFENFYKFWAGYGGLASVTISGDPTNSSSDSLPSRTCQKSCDAEEHNPSTSHSEGSLDASPNCFRT